MCSEDYGDAKVVTVGKTKAPVRKTKAEIDRIGRWRYRVTVITYDDYGNGDTGLAVYCGNSRHVYGRNRSARIAQRKLDKHARRQDWREDSWTIDL